MADNVKVIVRCRPFNEKEKKEGAHNVVHCDHDMATITIDPPNLEEQNAKKARGEVIMNEKVPRTFTFDGVYGEESKNIDMFIESFRPVVEAVTQGYNACIFAYGQTGSGKTFTMSGVPGNAGCIPNSFQCIFDYMSKQDNSKIEFLLKASYIEIYNEEIRDLVTNQHKLQLKESKDRGVYIAGVSEHVCQTEADLLRVMDDGYKNRSVAETAMNKTSSRSHNIFMVRLEQCEEINGKDTFKVGILNLVDLAGSERQSKTHAEGQRLKEAASINLSLTTLGVVIQKLVDGASHIPYRDSILTRLLQNSLGGNSKTLMMAALNPASTNYDESMSTLRYADQAKRIKNKPRINEDPKDAQIREMRDRIKQLEEQLKNAMASGTISEANMAKLKNVMAGMKAMGQDEPAQEAGDTIEEIEEVEDPEEAEKLRQLNNQKQSLAEQLKQRDEQASASKIAIEEMKNQLAALKGAVVQGKELEDSNREKERLLRETRIKLVERQEKELKLKRDLQAKQEEMDKQKAMQGSIDEQIAEVRKQIDDVKQHICGINQDIQSAKKENADKMDDLNDDYEQLNRQLLLKQFLFETLIPPFEQAKLESWIRFDEDKQEWTLMNKERLTGMLTDARDVRVQFPRGNNAAQVVHGEGVFVERQIDMEMEQPD